MAQHPKDERGDLEEPPTNHQGKVTTTTPRPSSPTSENCDMRCEIPATSSPSDTWNAEAKAWILRTVYNVSPDVEGFPSLGPEDLYRFLDNFLTLGLEIYDDSEPNVRRLEYYEVVGDRVRRVMVDAGRVALVTRD